MNIAIRAEFVKQSREAREYKDRQTGEVRRYESNVLTALYGDGYMIAVQLPEGYDVPCKRGAVIDIELTSFESDKGILRGRSRRVNVLK